MAEKKEVKKRNVAIEFWRFFTAVAMCSSIKNIVKDKIGIISYAKKYIVSLDLFYFVNCKNLL